MDKDQYGLQAAYVILSMAAGIYLILRPFTTFLLRRRLIELGLWNEKLHRQLGEESRKPYESLKWGLVLLFTGIGMIIITFLPFSYDSSLPYGVVAVGAAVGFLVYYRIVMRHAEADSDSSEEEKPPRLPEKDSRSPTFPT